MEHLEERMDNLAEDVKAHRAETGAKLESIGKQLGELLELKHRGQGAFWLVMTIVGGGFVTVAVALWELVTGRIGHG